MPIYEFKCKHCGHVFEELFFSLREEREVCCPSCQSKDTEKLMSLFGGRFGSASAGASCSSCSTTSCPPS